jgi:hypothetical protein
VAGEVVVGGGGVPRVETKLREYKPPVQVTPYSDTHLSCL